MEREAAELVQKVLPVATYGHVAVSYPFELNYKLAFQPKLLSRVERAVTKFLTKWTKARGIRASGGVLFRHRFGADLELRIHDHILLLDEGITLVPVAWNERTGEVEVWRGAETQQSEIDELAEELWKRIKKVLKQNGVAMSGKGNEARTRESDQLELFEIAATKKERSTAAVGRMDDDEVEEPLVGMWARAEGLHVYASAPIDGKDRENLEKLCRYLLRPAFSPGRLGQRGDGKVTYRLKRKDKAGNTLLVMTPIGFLTRLGTLMAGPRQRTKRLFGVLGPRAKGRKTVLPEPRGAKCRHGDDGRKKESGTVAKVPEFSKWALPMEQKWGKEERECPRCGGRMRCIARVGPIGGSQEHDVGMSTSKQAQGPPGRECAPAPLVA
jgi:hypothetical protein